MTNVAGIAYFLQKPFCVGICVMWRGAADKAAKLRRRGVKEIIQVHPL